MSDRLTVTISGFDVEVEFDGFRDENYGNSYEVTRVTIDGCAAEQVLGDTVRRRIEEALHAAVNGLVEEDWV